MNVLGNKNIFNLRKTKLKTFLSGVIRQELTMTMSTPIAASPASTQMEASLVVTTTTMVTNMVPTTSTPSPRMFLGAGNTTTSAPRLSMRGTTGPQVPLCHGNWIGTKVVTGLIMYGMYS